MDIRVSIKLLIQPVLYALKFNIRVFEMEHLNKLFLRFYKINIYSICCNVYSVVSTTIKNTLDSTSSTNFETVFFTCLLCVEY